MCIQTLFVRLVFGMLVLLTTASTSCAQAVYFRNDTSATVTIYASCVYRGVLLRAVPVQLQPKMVSPPLKLPGTKVILIRETRPPARALFSGTIPAADEDRTFAIAPDQPAPRVKLNPIAPPTPAKP